MSILYIPVLKKKGLNLFDESLPSPLFGRVSEEEWKEIIVHMNGYLYMRRNRLVFKLLSPFIIGNILRSVSHFYVDRRVKEYLDKKNLILSHSGVHIHHPIDRLYAGIDVSIHAIASDSPVNI